MNTDQGPRRLLLITVGIVCLCVFTYTHTHLDLRSRLWDAKSSSATSQMSAEEQQQQQQQQQHGHSVVKVNSAGNFRDRVAAFNTFLSSLRVDELKRRADNAWQRPNSSRLNVVWSVRDDYLQLLSNYTNVMTVALPWLTNSSGSAHTWSSLQDHSNLLIQTYYRWTADDTLCSWIETPGKIKAKYDAVYNRKCARNINDTARPVSLEPLFLNAKPVDHNYYWPNNGNSYPEHFYTTTPPYAFHLHIHRDAIVTGLGDVITDGLKLVLYACSHDINPAFPFAADKLEQIPLYNELYVINQFWGNSVFHRMTEIVPRLALHLQFLKANAEIRILAPESGGRMAELLEIVGLDKSRLVSGVARAKIVYQPRATGCGFANVQESQMVSQLYHDYIRRSFPPQPRNKLILIRRSGLRRFTEQKGIEDVLERAAKDYNLTYTLFTDNPTPSLNDTMMMFHSAAVIVGPHGAGLSNMYFSLPGTYVVEGVCDLPGVNLCYLRLAHILGHHWHGVTSRGGCESVVDVSATQINSAVMEYLRLLTSHS